MAFIVKTLQETQCADSDCSSNMHLHKKKGNFQLFFAGGARNNGTVRVLSCIKTGSKGTPCFVQSAPPSSLICVYLKCLICTYRQDRTCLPLFPVKLVKVVWIFSSETLKECEEVDFLNRNHNNSMPDPNHNPHVKTKLYLEKEEADRGGRFPFSALSLSPWVRLPSL